MKQSLELMGTDNELQMQCDHSKDGFESYVRVTLERNRILRKRWHLSSTQLGILLGISGGFFFIAGIMLATLILTHLVASF